MNSRKMNFASNYEISELNITEIEKQLERLEDTDDILDKLREYIQIVKGGKETYTTKKLLNELYNLLEKYEKIKGNEFSEMAAKMPKEIRYKNRFKNLIKFEESKLPKWDDLKAIFENIANEPEKIQSIKQWKSTFMDSEDNPIVELLLLEIDNYILEKSLTIK